MISNTKSIVIDPSSAHYFANKLFDISDSKLNRDGTLLPFHRMHLALKQRGVAINTVDLLLQERIRFGNNQYFSLGMLANISALERRKDVELKGFLIMEPPIVAPELYEALPDLTRCFDAVYVHNTVGDGYSLIGVDQSRLRKLYWPQPYFGVIDEFWSKSNRLNKIVVINGNHKPRIRRGELYSKRIEAMAALALMDAVDLYGRGWKRWWARSSFWMPYWCNRKKLMSVYYGECSSKYEILSRYQFSLCFENMIMNGYVTEKIFDCLYAGTIPLYLGAPDIDLIIPPDVYIDVRKFSSWQDMWSVVSRLTDAELSSMREAGKIFLNSEKFFLYYDALKKIVS